MSIFKCKMCGGTLEINNNETVASCEYCGTQQTLPKLDDEKMANMYDRANHFRRNNEFDKAMGIYEQILNEDNTDAEAYWSLVLCRYGIEYVEDPSSHKRVPTVNRAQYTSIFDDDNYKSALQNADSYQKAIYEEEAKAINEIQKGILEISQKEDPFDVFICYKETDNNGRRTPDSVLANDLYHQLTQEGFKVFFSRITLEDKLGSAYEPYIFAALNSSKVMVVLGTKPEFFNAVWVKNEWSRYLALIKNGAKKMLIPAYKDMDPYDLPEEFSHLQAQDMSKLGFMQDLIRGIKKIVSSEIKETLVQQTQVIENATGNVKALLDRGFMSLEDSEWQKADDFFEQVLNFDAKLAEAYLGKLMAENECNTVSQIGSNASMVSSKSELESKTYIIEECDSNLTLVKLVKETLHIGLREAKDITDSMPFEISIPSKFVEEFRKICQMHEVWGGLDGVGEIHNPVRESINYERFIRFATQQRADEINSYISDWEEKIKEEKSNEIYTKALNLMNSASTDKEFNEALTLFGNLSDYKDSLKLANDCETKVRELLNDSNYQEAVSILRMAIDEEEFIKGIKILESLGDYRDSAELKNKYNEEWQFRKENSIKIWKDYCELNDRILALTDEINKKTELAEKLKKDIENSKNAISEIRNNSEQIDSLEKQYNATQQQLSQATVETASLGVFAFSRKKELATKIKKLTDLSNEYLEKIATEKQFIAKAGSIDSLNLSIKNNEKSVAECFEKVKLLNDEVTALIANLTPIMEKLENRQVIAVLAHNEDIFPRLLDEYSIIRTIKADEELRNMIQTSEFFCSLPKTRQKSISSGREIDTEAVYFQARQALEMATSMEDIKWARGEFSAIRKYKDSDKLLKKCNEMIANNVYKM